MSWERRSQRRAQASSVSEHRVPQLSLAGRFLRRTSLQYARNSSCREGEVGGRRILARGRTSGGTLRARIGEALGTRGSRRADVFGRSDQRLRQSSLALPGEAVACKKRRSSSQPAMHAQTCARPGNKGSCPDAHGLRIDVAVDGWIFWPDSAVPVATPLLERRASSAIFAILPSDFSRGSRMERAHAAEQTSEQVSTLR